MKKAFLRFITTVFAVAFMAMLMPSFAFADSGGFTTESFNVDVVTDEDHVFHVSEEITVNFFVPRHGIYRYIPEEEVYDIKHISVQGYDYETYTENNSMVIKIGSGDYTVYGRQTYKITYDIVGFKDPNDRVDFLAIDMLPTGWSTEIESSKLHITFPKRIDDIEIYSGIYEYDDDQGYFLTSQDGKSLTAVSRGTVPQGVGYTVEAELPDGYWVNPKDKYGALPGFCGAIGIIALLMLGLWGLIGHDNAVIKPVEFYPPDGMDPLQVDYVTNGKIDPKDVAAEFLYFANKGYLKVIQEAKKSFRLDKISNINNEETYHAKSLFREMFSERDSLYMGQFPTSFGECVAKIVGEVKDSLGENKKVFTTKSIVSRFIGYGMCALIPLLAGCGFTYCGFMSSDFYIVSILFAVIIGFLSWALIRKADTLSSKKKPVKFTINAIFLGIFVGLETFLIGGRLPVLAVVFVAAQALALISTVFVKKRANNDIYGRVMGFKNFIKTAEYDRLKALSDEDPEYYFNIMPYAYIFGMSTNWAEKFADFKLPQPSWYEGGTGYDPFFHGYMYNSLSHGVGITVNDYYKSIGADIVGDVGSGGGGGFGGGGFSGGGFGGGGGGSW